MRKRLFSAKSNIDINPALEAGKLVAPNHISMIMDGNGRWAKSRGLPRSAGHKKGAETVRLMIESCVENKIDYLTLYAFSSENWQRSDEEVQDLMSLLRFYLEKELSSLHKQGVKLLVIGERDKLSKDIQQKITDAEILTNNNEVLTLSIALSYGGRQEITQAMRIIASEVKSGNIAPEEIDENVISKYLYTAKLPLPDLLIRTGGEHRLSNFLLWQSAYTELYFTDILWPDFSKENFKQAIKEYSNRERRYGTA